MWRNASIGAIWSSARPTLMVSIQGAASCIVRQNHRLCSPSRTTGPTYFAVMRGVVLLRGPVASTAPLSHRAFTSSARAVKYSCAVWAVSYMPASDAARRSAQ